MVSGIGPEFGGYRIICLLGRGGMSEVYRAESPPPGTTVALKILAPELAGEEALRERFERESRLVASLNHPSIVPIYEAGEADGRLYIAMRLLATDLGRVLESRGPLSPERTVTIIADVAGALDAAAAEGLVHRDVKPANILLDGFDGRAYLADFGVAKRTEALQALTEHGEFLGTIDYMAPEQIEDRTLDGRADQYSLGCVAFECLTGSPPFRRESEAAVLWAHMQEAPPAAGALRAGLASGIDDVLACVLAKSPDDRFASCREFGAALEAAARGEHPVARRAPPPPAGDRRDESSGARRRPARRLLGLAVLVAAVVAALALREDDPPRVVTERVAADSPTPTETAENDLTAFDVALLPAIPATFRASCVHVEPIRSGFDATLRCDPSDLQASVLFSHARSGDILREHLREQVVEAGIPLSPAEGLTAGGWCPAPLPALQEWEMDGPAGHREVDSLELLEGGMTRGRPSAEGDRARALLRERRAVPAPMGGSPGVYAQATGDPQALTDWWRSEVGPRH